MDEQAQRAGGQTAQPTWLMLTEVDGGLAKRGFWICENNGDRFVDQPYVALVVDAASIADGGFEEIFAHETGHVLLRRLIPRLPAGMALKSHDAGLNDKPFAPLWQSHVDGTLRIDGVRRNWFFHRQLLPPGDDDVWARRANSSAFDVAALKNGNQMMASEGVVPTLFYRAMAPHPTVARYASLFRAMQHLNNQHLQPNSPLVPSARAQMAALIERTIQQPSELTAALGPAIWIANSQALVINLNTVEADQFAALDGFFAECAQNVQAERDAHGPYRDLNDLAQRADLPEAIVARLHGMADTAITLGAYARL